MTNHNHLDLRQHNYDLMDYRLLHYDPYNLLPTYNFITENAMELHWTLLRKLRAQNI